MVVLKNLILKSNILWRKKYNILIQKCDGILKSPCLDVKLVKKSTKNGPKICHLMHFCSLGGFKTAWNKVCVGLIKPKPGEHDDMDGFLWIVYILAIFHYNTCVSMLTWFLKCKISIYYSLLKCKWFLVLI